MLCLNDSLFLFEANCCFPKRKKEGGGANVRSLRLKNWLPLESTIYIRLLDHNTLKVCYFVNLDHSFY